MIFILKQKKTKEKYQTKQQKKFMIHTHDKFINYCGGKSLNSYIGP